MHFNIETATYDKLTYDIILIGRKRKAFPLRSGTGQARLLSLLELHIALDILTRAIR